MSKRLQSRSSSRTTLGDVARAAGVSTATVSRTLNQPASVRTELREKVMLEVVRLGYVADGAARALASRRSRSIGAVIPTLANAIFAEGMDAFEARLGEDGYSLVLAQSGYDPGQELRHVQNLIERGVDGIMLIGRMHDPGVHGLLDQHETPSVETWTYGDTDGRPTVGFDNDAAAQRITRHLLDLGHRQFAMISGISTGNDRAQDRIAGTCNALAANGLKIEPDRLIECDYDIAEGRQAMRRLFTADKPPTAVICGNDVLAIGALLECQASGIKVPETVSITGFDDLPLARHLTPALTTVHVPSKEMGERAAEYLISHLDGGQPGSETELDVDLIVRGTTAPPRD